MQPIIQKESTIEVNWAVNFLNVILFFWEKMGKSYLDYMKNERVRKPKPYLVKMKDFSRKKGAGL